MNRAKIVILLMAVAMLGLSASSVWAQSSPGQAYLEHPVSKQTRNIPAGTVNDPASHLTYILDTGVNARDLLNDVPLDTATSTVLVDLQPWLDEDQDEQLDEGAIRTHFVSIKNTHPTQAVTVHFRYFNDNCDDVLDFLVILTCNDTLIFNPFDFEIPGSGGENTKDRFFGPARPGKVLSPIPTVFWGSGRFILTAAASGASVDLDDDAEILFPEELGKNLNGECNIVADVDDDLACLLSDSECDDLPAIGQAMLDEILAGEWQRDPDADPDDDDWEVGNPLVNVGLDPGLAQYNLHVFNASQISHNYLVGTWTEAQIVELGGVDQFQAGGINAWGRPAVDLKYDNAMDINGGHGTPDVDEPSRITGFRDGDGKFCRTGKIVTGGEQIPLWDIGVSHEDLPRLDRDPADGPFNWDFVHINHCALRNEVHGGDLKSHADPLVEVEEDVWVNQTGIGGESEFGALASADFLPVAPTDIIQNFMSVQDDYNGSTNIGVGDFPDLSANIQPAATTFVLQIYDNNEDLLEFPPDTPLNVSPPVIGKTVELKMVCICLRTFLTTTISPGTNVDDVTIQEMADILGSEVLDGKDDFDGLLVPVAPDLSGGWIRYVRCNTSAAPTGVCVVDDLDECLQRDGGVCVLTRAQSVGLTVEADAWSGGTSGFKGWSLSDSVNNCGHTWTGHTLPIPPGPPSDANPDPGEVCQTTVGPTFVSIATQFTRSEGFGALWWKFSSASNPCVSVEGKVRPKNDPCELWDD